MTAPGDAIKLMSGTALALTLGAGPVWAQADDTYCTFGDVESYEEIFERYDRLDIDDDNRITLAEFETCLDETGVPDEDREQYLTEFEEIDADDDDVLVTAEVEAVVIDPEEEAALDEDEGPLGAEVVSLAEWRYEDMYGEGMSADVFMDEMEVYSVGGEEIGDVEDIIVGQDGTILAVIAEVGGFWDMGDTHVSVPWDEIEMGDGGVVVPVTEETIEDYDIFDREYLTADAAANRMVGGVDAADMAGRSYRLSELIGDYARLAGDDGPPLNYGYVNDVILRDGEVAAIVVEPGTGYGVGYRAYPYYGYGYAPGSRYYDMPYTEDEIGEVGEFDYEEL